MEHLTILVSPEGQWVLPGTSEFFAALGDPDPDYDAVSFAVRNLGFIKFEVIQQSIVEIELHPRNVELPALLAVQQQLLSSDLRLFRIKYFDTSWHSEISSSVEGDDRAPVGAVRAALHADDQRAVSRRAAGFRNALRGRAQRVPRHRAEMARFVRAFRPEHHPARDAQPASAAAGDHRRKAAAEGSGVALCRPRAWLDGRGIRPQNGRREGRGHSGQGLRRMGQRLLPIRGRIRAGRATIWSTRRCSTATRPASRGGQSATKGCCCPGRRRRRKFS